MQSLTEYYATNNIPLDCEGFSQQVKEQIDDLILFVQKEGVKSVLEIGFNAGHSSEIFLTANPDCTVVSFDLGVHDIVKHGKTYIDQVYPGRHTLILGDSTKTVPEYDTGVKFDLIFIDGGHDYDTAYADICNCRRLAHENTIVLIDDVIMSYEPAEYWAGPTRAVQDAIKEGLIVNASLREFHVEGLPRGMVKCFYDVSSSPKNGLNGSDLLPAELSDTGCDMGTGIAEMSCK